MLPPRTSSWIYGLSVQGEAGVRHVMRSLLADFDILMNCAGYNSISEINRTALKYLPHGGSFPDAKM